MNIAIIGATGMVGQNFLKLLNERNFPITELRLFASKKNEGKKLSFRSQELTVKSLQEDSFNNLNIVFFSSGEEISRQWAPKAAQAGAMVIDNSSAFRMEKDIPLIVPEVNADQIKELKTGGGIIANPNCSTIQLVLVLKPLDSHFELESVHVSSYQSLSGAGRAALNLLKKESQDILNEQNKLETTEREESSNKNQPQSISNKQNYLSLSSNEKSMAFNCIPQIGTLNKEGFSTEEAKLMRETKKILNRPNLKITATAVRVPTFNGHGEAIVTTFKKPANKKEIMAALQEAKGLSTLEDNHLPHQRFVDGRDDVYVGRIRAVPEEKGKSWMMWIAADNLRKGAALNGLQIAELLAQ